MRGSGRTPVVQPVRVGQPVRQPVGYAEPTEALQLGQHDYHLSGKSKGQLDLSQAQIFIQHIISFIFIRATIFMQVHISSKDLEAKASLEINNDYK